MRSPGYTGRSSSFALFLPSLSLIASAGNSEPLTDRERTRHTAVPTECAQSFWKIPRQNDSTVIMTRSPSLSVSASPSWFTPSPRSPVSLYFLLSFTGADCSSSTVPVPISTASFPPSLFLPSLAIIASHRLASWWFSFLPRNALRTERNRFIVLPRRFESGKTRSDYSRKVLRPS